MARLKLKKVVLPTPASTPEMDAVNAVKPNSRSGVNFTNQTVVLGKRFFGQAANSLGEFYASGDRRFFASGGFGCNPEAIGVAVFGYFLSDGESARIDRGDIDGLAVNEAAKGDHERAELWQRTRYS